jgi:polygalacturonase
MPKPYGIVFLAAGLLACARLGAAIPGVSYDVRSYGALGDGTANDAPAINAAIDAASKAGGGTVEFPAGTYLSGSIRLRSDIGLHLGPGSTIVASPDASAYDLPEANSWGDSLHYQDGGHSHWHDSLIWGEDLTNISITGPGRIFGKGLSRGWSTETPVQNVGNKAIALRNCRNVILRDFTIEHGGWFGILATGADNMTIDGLRIDTNRDGMDIDCCHNVRISNCSVNSPWDDGICLKSSFGLGQFRSTEDVTISDCLVSGYDEGTLLDGTRRHTASKNPAPTGRIKFGTESNGGFKAITITNCVFECCRGLAIETVDGAAIEDVAISNITMRRIFTAPIFLRLGARMRGPDATPVGRLRHVLISNVIAEDVSADQGILMSGIPGHVLEDVTLDNIQMVFAGGGTAAQAQRDLPEMERDYPEPGSFGATPSWGVFARHVQDLAIRHVVLRTLSDDLRPPVVLDDVHGAELEHVAVAATRGVKPMEFRNVDELSIQSCLGVPDVETAATFQAQKP